MLARDRFPHGVVLSGPEGSGKYLLAQMIAKAMNCLNPPPGSLPDFCGECSNCQEIAAADDFATKFEEAVEAREGLRDADKKETRHLPADASGRAGDSAGSSADDDQGGPGAARDREHLQAAANGKHSIFIFTTSAMMKEAANSLLKVLEEPPEYATLFLLTTNPGEFLPTIRSRCITLQLAPLQPQELESLLAKRRSDWPRRRERW